MAPHAPLSELPWKQLAAEHYYDVVPYCCGCVSRKTQPYKLKAIWMHEHEIHGCELL